MAFFVAVLREGDWISLDPNSLEIVQDLQNKEDGGKEVQF